jgi:CRISPR-associated protein Csy3
VEKANLQRVDNCALSPEQDTLKLTFTLKVLSGVENPSACNSEGFNQNFFSNANTDASIFFIIYSPVDY